MKIIYKVSSIFYTLKGTFQSKLHFVLTLENGFNGKISTTHNNCICVPHNVHQRNNLSNIQITLSL